MAKRKNDPTQRARRRGTSAPLRVQHTQGDFPRAGGGRPAVAACCTTTCCATLIGGAAGLLGGGIAGLIVGLRRRLKEVPPDVPGMNTGLIKIGRFRSGQFDEDELVPLGLRSVFMYYVAAYAIPLIIVAEVILLGMLGIPGGFLIGLGGAIAIALRHTATQEAVRLTPMLKFGRIMLYITLYSLIGLILGAGIGLMIDTGVFR